MTRKALLIGNPGERWAENYCGGVEVDINNFNNYLMSAKGGGWYPQEITIKMRPTVEELRNELSDLSSFEYTFIAFCGHGYSWKEETILELQSDEEINANELKKGASKRTIILDSCRREEYRLDQKVENRMYEQFTHTAINDSRAIFDSIVSHCTRDIIVINSCAYNETAKDLDKYGGLYCYNYIKFASEYSLPRDTHLSVVGVHNVVKDVVVEKSNGFQNPTIYKPRSEPYFPFAV
jgi:hypothetical protein